MIGDNFSSNRPRARGGLLVARSRDGRLAGYRIVEKAGDEARVAIVSASTAEGRVVDTDGRALAGRRVQLKTEIPVNPSNMFQIFDFTTSDAEGRYRFPGLIPGTRCEVWVSHDERPGGSNGLSIEKFPVNGPDPITVPDMRIPGGPAATPPVTLGPKFRAEDVEGANPMPYAIARGEVEALIEAIGREPASPGVMAQVEQVLKPQESWITDLGLIRRSATDTRFVALADRASRATLGEPASTAALVYLAHLRRSGDTEAAMRNHLATWPVRKPGPPVRGVVRDSATGQPIAGAVVFNGVGSTATDLKGEFTLASSARRNLWVESDGYALAEAIQDGDTVKASLVLDRPIIGRVLERQGLKPVEGAEVWAMANHSLFLPESGRGPKDHYGFPLTARTDAQGRFAFRGIPPGVELDWFEIRHPRFSYARNGLKSLKADQVASLLVDPGCVVSGEVVDEVGRKLPGVSVGLRSPGNTGFRHSITTGDDGRYHFGNLEPGRYEMIVEPERQAFRTISVFARSGEPAINQVVVEAGWTVSGKVVDAAGRPLADIVVGWPIPIEPSGAVDETASMGRFAYTEADGRFELAGLAPGKYRITASGGSAGRQAKVDVNVNRPDLVITLPGVGK